MVKLSAKNKKTVTIKAGKAGKTTIKAKYGKKTYKCIVTVVPKKWKKTVGIKYNPAKPQPQPQAKPDPVPEPEKETGEDTKSTTRPEEFNKFEFYMTKEIMVLPGDEFDVLVESPDISYPDYSTLEKAVSCGLTVELSGDTDCFTVSGPNKTEQYHSALQYVIKARNPGTVTVRFRDRYGYYGDVPKTSKIICVEEGPVQEQYNQWIETLRERLWNKYGLGTAYGSASSDQKLSMLEDLGEFMIKYCLANTAGEEWQYSHFRNLERHKYFYMYADINKKLLCM